MQSGYQPEHWHEAFIMLGGASAALAGLIIVAVSVRADQLVGMQHWWRRARNNTFSMISVTIGSFLVLLPQAPAVLGAELIVLNVVCGFLLPGPIVLDRLRGRTDAAVHVPTVALALYLIAAAGGVSLLLQVGGGLFAVAFAYAAYLFLAPYNAYLMLLPHKGDGADSQ